MDLRDKSYEELLKILRTTSPQSDIYKAAHIEFQRIQDETNNKQTASLIVSIDEFKSSSNGSARRLEILTWVLVGVGLLTAYLGWQTTQLGKTTLEATTDPQVRQIGYNAAFPKPQRSYASSLAL